MLHAAFGCYFTTNKKECVSKNNLHNNNLSVILHSVTQHTPKVTHFTKTLDQQKKDKKITIVRHAHGEIENTLNYHCKKALEAFGKMATSPTVRRKNGTNLKEDTIKTDSNYLD